MFWPRNSKKQQLKAIFDWLTMVVGEKDIISVELSGEKGYFHFDFPIRYGDRPRRVHRSQPEQKSTFLVRAPSKIILNDPWINIFSSPEIEVFENTVRNRTPKPLRWGLTDEEKAEAFKIARNALQKFLLNGELLDRTYFNELSPRFYLRTDLDVALWVDGRLRGSAVVENRHLGEGIAEAALHASRDARFKPLSLEELTKTRIEITIMHNLRIPLSASERQKNRVYPEKGYLLVSDGKKGWFLPEVHNVLRFHNLEDLLARLAQEKAGLARGAEKNADVFVFEVDDFIESEDRSKPLSLYGPVIKNNHESLVHNQEFIIQRLRMAADWLCRIQEPDGNIPPIIDPLTGRIVRQIDWPRLAFTAWALAEFGKAINEEKYVRVAGSSFEYLRGYLFENRRWRMKSYELTLAYFGRLSLSFDKSTEAVAAAEKILTRLSNLSFEPITFSQIASFLKEIVKRDQRFHDALREILLTLKNRFETAQKTKEPLNLAAWAELVHTFNGVDNKFADEVTRWFKNQQLPSGAFPESTASDFVYSRGTGKIFEVLALRPEENKEEVSKALAWLLSMHYTDESAFFVSEEIRPKILGAFRHDYFNTEAWIDAAGHMLLGGARLVTKK